MEEKHIPVLLKESLSYLITDKQGAYFDGTIGFGGHASKFLEVLDPVEAKLVATEVDKDAYDFSKAKFQSDNRVRLYNTNFSEIDTVSKIEFIEHFDGIFADLGVSSFQLDNPESGFTYRSQSPLDLRLDKTKQISASDVINGFTEEEIADILYQFGEEKNSRRIAQRIVQQRGFREIETTTELAGIIEDLTPSQHLNKTLSRVFQALRIYVNDELGVLREFLIKSVELLKTGGNIVILTYHSLEDRVVKDFFKNESLSCVCPPDFPICVCDKVKRLEVLTRKPVAPSSEEIEINRRARSAKLRAARRV
ncbi:MAG: 16S rRNA (cytosine(1402)-N(4))-methyltransferase RsmH [Ignavibacteria bacterium]|jgi:16S rRNA (cytosine1402-N4)-methyltransferase|nr:16S rRNA (cytosine(1402)-N(4))-methyltransferase RsmH [Ignavibacteria bacterium]MCU7503161.1 16S rRNA (cytosine(1402)-N(4))-methyltransferase RsmH [Ignavibacteria bacterium]MCU7518039.1 16S rRNA (cytosine(1402)-N(4))-methyltransferase RsmH [Ignavibacteria bacterium]